MGSRIAQGVPLALPDTERPAALRTAVHEIERRWGLHAAGRLFGVSPAEAGFSSGIEALDQATGFDGVPRGRLSELTGAPGGGALTLGWRVLGAALEGGGLAAYVDLPGTFAPTASVAMDLDLSRLVVVRPPDAETALQASATLLRSHAFEAVLLDLESRAAAWQPVVAAGGFGGTGDGEPGGGDGGGEFAGCGAAVPSLAAAGGGLPGLALAAQPPGAGPDGADAGGSGAEVAQQHGGAAPGDRLSVCEEVRWTARRCACGFRAFEPRWRRRGSRRGRGSRWRSTRGKLTSGG